jgi:hypothetical protein
VEKGATVTQYLKRKLSGCCTRCGVELPEDADTNLCEAHRLDLCERVAASTARRRARRRLEAAITAVLPQAHIVIRRAC